MRATLETADAIGAEGVIFHVGSHLGAGLDGGASSASCPRCATLLELTTDDLWLLMENSAGTGGTIGRSTDELARIYDSARPPSPARHLPRLVPLVRLGGRRHRSGGTGPGGRRARRADRARPPALPARQRLAGRARLEPRPARVGRARADGRRAPHLPRPSRVPGATRDPGDAGPEGHGPDAAELARLRALHAGKANPGRPAEAGHRKASASAWAQSDSCANTRKLAAASGISKNSGLRQPTSSRPLLVARLDLGVAHRQRRAPRDDGAEAVAAPLGRAQQIEVDLDVEHALHAAHVRVAERLVRVHERRTPARRTSPGTRPCRSAPRSACTPPRPAAAAAARWSSSARGVRSFPGS